MLDGRDESEFALADKSRPSPWVAETDVPVLTDAKYPNALLLDGSRKMTEHLQFGVDNKGVMFQRGGVAHVLLRPMDDMVAVRNPADTDYRDIIARNFRPQVNLWMKNNSRFMSTYNDAYFFSQWHTGIGATDVAKVVDDSIILLRAGDITGLAGKTLDFPNINVDQLNLRETAYFDAEYDNGDSGTSKTIDFGVGNKQKLTLTGDCTLTFTNPSGPCNLVLKLVQDATGGRLVTWDADCKWVAGTPPTLSTGAGDIDIVTFYFDGTYYYGAFLGDFA